MLATQFKTALLSLIVLPLSFSFGSFAGFVLGGFACLWFYLDQSLKEEETQRASRRRHYPSKLPGPGAVCWNIPT